MKKLMAIATLLMATTVFAAGAAKINSDVNRGIDCELFLNPYIDLELREVSGLMILDAGCGLAPRSIAAAQKGARVYSFESKKNVLEKAQVAIRQAGLESQIALCHAHFNELPYEANIFDKAFVINELNCKELQVPLAEMARVMKPGAHLMLVAPSSVATLFTDGCQSDELVYHHISRVLAKIGKSEDPAVITKHLSELKEVMRASFARDPAGFLRLVTDEKSLTEGQSIWCKVPEGVIGSIYHNEEAYLVAINQANLRCEEIKRPCFFGRVKYNVWRASAGQSLGEAYLMNHPFTIYYLVKR